MNPGGLRADLKYASPERRSGRQRHLPEAATVQPFANTLVTMTSPARS